MESGGVNVQRRLINGSLIKRRAWAQGAGLQEEKLTG